MGTRITPYTPAEEEAKSAQVARMFDRIAHSYDALNHLFSFGIDILWRKRAVRILRKRLAGRAAPWEVLDVATGTADFALELVRMGLPVRVTGVDISVGMLDVGRVKVGRKGWTDRITLVEGDSAALPFASGSFDAVCAAFGVRNFEDLDAGLGHMVRVLKPGGTLCVLEFSRPTAFPMKQLFGLYFRRIMPAVGRWVSKDSAAYTYLPESVAAFPDGEAFLDRMRAAGCVEVREVRLTGGVASLYFGTAPGA